jgi:hypothetical protein
MDYGLRIVRRAKAFCKGLLQFLAVAPTKHHTNEVNQLELLPSISRCGSRLHVFREVSRSAKGAAPHYIW